MESYGERQVSTNLEGIREDHRQRYCWAIDRIRKDAEALDAGCGVGYGSHLLSQKAGRVSSFDIAEEAIAYANRFWKNDAISFDVCDLHFFARQAEQPLFEAVTCFECIEHLAIPELFLIRLRAYLTDKARIFLSVPHESVQPFYLHRNPYHFMHYTISDLKALLDRCGYELVELCSQDDDEVRPDQDGRFLLAECAKRDEEPQVKLEELEAELPDRMQHHFTAMGQELAKALGVRAKKDLLEKHVAERDERLRERTQRLAEVDRERLIAQSKLAGAESMRRELDMLRQETRKQCQALSHKLEQEIKKSQQQSQKLQEQGQRLQQQDRKLRQQEKQIREIWNHPAIRRLARFNQGGLKLLGLFGLSLRRTAASPQPKPIAPPKAFKGLLGKEPVQLDESAECYRQGYVAAAHVYGAAGRATSGKRIVIDATRVFDEHLTGVGHYCDQLMRALLRRAPHEIALYSGRPLPKWLLDYPGYPQFYHCPPNKVVRDFSKYKSAPTLESITGPADLYLDISAAYAPILQVSNRLGCIYDLAPISCPETVPEQVTQACVSHAKFMAENCNHMVAISDYSKQEFVKHTGCDANKIAVIPVGMDPVFLNEITAAERERVRARYSLSEPYILCVGTLQPRKNLIRLVRAYARLQQERPDLPRLLLTGTDKWGDVPEFTEEFEKLHQEHRVEWLGYVDRNDMPALYNMSEFFIYPSYFEGYGMPVAEAMASGAAVICGDNTSLPEVAGDAALYCDVMDIDAIAEAMKRALVDPALRQKLRLDSKERATTFLDWNAVADQYLKQMAARL